MRAILFICLTLWMVGCGTRKAERQERKDVHLEESLRLIESTVSGLTLTDSIGERLRREKVYKITILSPPDSAGRQWPELIEEGTVTEEYAADRITGRDSTGVTNRKEGSNTLIEDKSQLKEKTKVDNRIVPLWVWWVVAIGGGIAIFLYFKRRIFK